MEDESVASRELLRGRLKCLYSVYWAQTVTYTIVSSEVREDAVKDGARNKSASGQTSCQDKVLKFGCDLKLMPIWRRGRLFERKQQLGDGADAPL